MVDAAIVDGAIAMMGVMYAFQGTALVRDGVGQNYLAGAAPWYDTYATRDGKFVSVGPLEPQFLGLLLDKLGLDRTRFAPLGFPAVDAASRIHWGDLRAELQRIFATRTRAEWCQLLEGTDACFAPVLGLDEAPLHPHNKARGSFIEVDGVRQHAPVPRFGRSQPEPVRAPSPAGADTDAVLRAVGYSAATIDELRSSGALA